MGKRKNRVPMYYQKNIAKQVEKRYREMLKARAELLEREKRERQEKKEPEAEPES